MVVWQSTQTPRSDKLDPSSCGPWNYYFASWTQTAAVVVGGAVGALGGAAAARRVRS